MNTQDSMPPPEVSNHIATGPEKFSLAEAHKNLKMAIMSMSKYLKEGTNECLNEDCKNTNSWMNKNISRHENKQKIFH